MDFGGSSLRPSRNANVNPDYARDRLGKHDVVVQTGQDRFTVITCTCTVCTKYVRSMCYYGAEVAPRGQWALPAGSSWATKIRRQVIGSLAGALSTVQQSRCRDLIIFHYVCLYNAWRIHAGSTSSP
jgi:hypothetical protein